MEINNFKNIEGTYVIDTQQSGKTITIFGGIHGDEISGINAINKFLQEINEGNIDLKIGKLILVPKSNLEAIKQNKREVEHNLNRLFINQKKGNSYEEKRSIELIKILDVTDYFLDIHSTSEESLPFIFAESHSVEIAKGFGISHIVTGWEGLDKAVGGCTQTYIDSNNGIGFTFEAGSHLDINATSNSYQMILNFLSYFGFINKKYFKEFGKTEIYNIEDIYVNKSGNFNYKIKNLVNFSEVKSGEYIGIDGGDEIIAVKDEILFMPKSESIIKKGEEVFFYVKKV